MRVRLRDRAAPSSSGSHLGFRCASTLPDADCAFGRDTHGDCLAGVLEADCRAGKVWNGARCALPGEEGCGHDRHLVPGHGCVLEAGAAYASNAPLDTAGVSRARSPEFDADCQHFQPQRPHAYRFKGATHDARNAVERSQGCKNRDVGSGWNSACCP
jgi:hypothetical protein